MTIIHATNGRISVVGPPKRCLKCKKCVFDKIDWDGLAYVCRGCGRVYEPQPSDPMANLTQALQDAGAVASIFSSAFSDMLIAQFQQLADEEIARYQKWARQGDIADALRYAAQACETFLEEAVEAPPAPPRDPYRSQNWRAMERRHGQRYRGKKR